MKQSRMRRIIYTCLLSISGIWLLGCEEVTQSSELPEMPKNTNYTTTADTTESNTEITTTTTTPTEIPASCLIADVPFQTQNGFLPTGCELISAMMLLHYYDIPVSIDEIVAHTPAQYPEKIGTEVYAPHPSRAFIGSPKDSTSFGCYAPVIVDMLSQFLPDTLQAVDTTGAELRTLAETYLPYKQPILVWATIGMQESYQAIGWYLLDDDGTPTDEWYYWTAREHCLVLVGYNENYYFFNDPNQDGAPTPYARELVETRFAELGKMSVVVTSANERNVATPE